MRLVSKLPGPYLWMLLFMILCDLRCHASFSGPELYKSPDEGQGSIQIGKRVRGGVDEDPLHGGADEDGEYDEPLHGGSHQDGEYDDPLHGGADQDGEYDDPLHGGADQDGEYDDPLHGGTDQDGKYDDPIHGGADQDGEYEHPLRGGADQVGEYKDPLRGGTDQDGEYEDPLHGRLEPRSVFNAPEGDNVYSSRVDFPCPKPADIEPCLCTVDAAQNIDLDCTHVISEEQLAAVFQQDFPVKTLRYFTMAENSNIKLLDNILNGVNFQKIELNPGPFALSAISDYFFLSCRESLDYLAILNTNLTSASFPFVTFAVMEKLTYIEVRGSHFTWIPSIIAPAVSALFLTYGKTEIVQAGTFPIREGPIRIYLYSNLIHTVEPGSFYFTDENSMASNADVTIGLYSNMLRYIKAETFPIRNGPTHIYLYNNQIEVMEPGAFVLPGNTSQLDLHLDLNNNHLTAFSEEVFGELMPYTIEVFLLGNPLVCDCAMAWIITSPEYLAKIDGETTCEDGTNLHDLDPEDYINFC